VARVCLLHDNGLRIGIDGRHTPASVLTRRCQPGSADVVMTAARADLGYALRPAASHKWNRKVSWWVVVVCSRVHELDGDQRREGKYLS
jgi:hypothetical protein